MARKPDLLKDSLWYLVRKLALPGVIGMLILSVNSLIDALYVGNLIGAEAFAGISLLMPFTLIVSGVTGFISSGTSSLMSRALGAKNVEMQQKIIPNMLGCVLICSIFLMVIGYYFSDLLVWFIGAGKEESKAGSDYLQTYLLGNFFIIYGLTTNSLIRAEGKIGQAMTITVIAVIINIVTTPVFIDTLQLGVKGAAMSSIFSMFVYSIFTSLYFIKRKASFEIGSFRPCIQWQVLKQIANVGLSSLVMQLTNVLRQFVIFRSVTWYGTSHDLIMFSAIYRLFAFFSVISMGVLQPLQPIVGMNYGAGNRNRYLSAVKVFRLAASLTISLLLLFPMISPELFLGLLLPTKQVPVRELNLFRYILLILPFLPISSSVIIFFQATGKGKDASVFPLIRQFALFVPMILLFPYLLSTEGIYYALIFENVLYAMALWIIFRTNKVKYNMENDAQLK